ncbi:MAG: ferritin family protein [Candidatus Omnitrophota bacterium]
MGNIFAGSEVVELGIQIERNGKDFYEVLAAQSKNPKGKDSFALLAKEEEKHIAVFQGILKKTQGYEPPQSYPGEYLAYMNALASEHIFTQKDKGRGVAQGIKTDREAVDMALGFEKDSIIFYEGMKKMVPAYEQKIIDELIIQEQAHLSKLSALKNNL